MFIIFWDGISSKMGVVGHGVTVMTPAVKEVEFFLAPFLDVVLGGDFKNCHHFDVRIAHDRVDDAKVENCLIFCFDRVKRSFGPGFQKSA